jgi:hypothetical protein
MTRFPSYISRSNIPTSATARGAKIPFMDVGIS